MQPDLKTKLYDADIVLDRAGVERLERFAELLMEWSGTHNLTGAVDVSDIYDNIVDSLYPTTFVDVPSSMLDVGSGGGFPGLVLAVVWHDTEVVLCEPRNKRAAFLKYAAMELGLSNVKVAKTRVENLEHEPFGLICSRAVSDAAMLVGLTDHLKNDKTQYLFYKGSRAEDEMEALNSQPNYVIVQWKKRNFVWIK